MAPSVPNFGGLRAQNFVHSTPKSMGDRIPGFRIDTGYPP